MIVALVTLLIGTFAILSIEKCQEGEVKKLEIQWKIDSLKHIRK